MSKETVMDKLDNLKRRILNATTLLEKQEILSDLDDIKKDLIALKKKKKLNIDPFGWTLVIIDDRYFLRCISGSLELSKENYLILKGQGY